MSEHIPWYRKPAKTPKERHLSTEGQLIEKDIWKEWTPFQKYYLRFLWDAGVIFFDGAYENQEVLINFAIRQSIASANGRRGFRACGLSNRGIS